MLMLMSKEKVSINHPYMIFYSKRKIIMLILEYLLQYCTFCISNEHEFRSLGFFFSQSCFSKKSKRGPMTRKFKPKCQSMTTTITTTARRTFQTLLWYVFL